ncbi:hypothetical protein DKP78_21900, partial [Enterococcus faecium]
RKWKIGKRRREKVGAVMKSGFQIWESSWERHLMRSQVLKGQRTFVFTKWLGVQTVGKRPVPAASGRNTTCSTAVFSVATEVVTRS